MESIGPHCKELKQQYDECFNAWFQERYLKGDYHSNLCNRLFENYQGCVREAIKRQKIDLWQIDKDSLPHGAPQDNEKPNHDQKDSAKK